MVKAVATLALREHGRRMPAVSDRVAEAAAHAVNSGVSASRQAALREADHRAEARAVKMARDRAGAAGDLNLASRLVAAFDGTRDTRLNQFPVPRVWAAMRAEWWRRYNEPAGRRSGRRPDRIAAAFELGAREAWELMTGKPIAGRSNPAAKRAHPHERFAQALAAAVLAMDEGQPPDPAHDLWRRALAPLANPAASTLTRLQRRRVALRA